MFALFLMMCDRLSRYVCVYVLFALLYCIQTDVVGDWAWGLKVPGNRQLCCCFVSASQPP